MQADLPDNQLLAIMTTFSLFRLFIVCMFLTGMAGSLLDTVVPGLLQPEVKAAVEAAVASHTSQTSMIVVGVLSLAMLVAGIASVLGLWFFKSWARPLCLWISLISILLYPALGPMVFSGWALMLFASSLMFWGALLAMAYFSELKLRFQNER